MNGTALTAQQVYAQFNPSPDTVRAMVRAERFGHADTHGAQITHAGYAAGVTEFSAATALYTVRW